MIKTLIFDLGGVIVPFEFRRAYQALDGRCPYSAEEIPRRIGSTDLVRRLETGQIEARDFVDQLTRLLEVKLDYDEFRLLWSSIFLPETLVPDSLLAALGARYRMLLLSNTNVIHFEMIREAYPLLGHFDHFVLSYQVGALKPAARIYHAALEQARCRPEECFFTDDIPVYVEAARRERIDAVRFTGLAQLESDLRQRGVEW